MKGFPLLSTDSEETFSAYKRHNLLISIEKMPAVEYKNGGNDLSINYNFYESIFGKVLIASTPKGICYMAFEDDEVLALQHLIDKFPKVILKQNSTDDHAFTLSILHNENPDKADIKLHLKGTEFQLRVWKALLKVPFGQVSNYASIAKEIENEKAYRAVGTAIGSNAVAFLIPCHRIISSTGNLGQYRWGSDKKAAMIAWERAQINSTRYYKQ